MVGVAHSSMKYEAINGNQLLLPRVKKVPLSIFSAFVRKYTNVHMHTYNLFKTLRHLLIFGISLK